MMLLSLAMAIQAPAAASPPLEAYGAEPGWHIQIGSNGVLFRMGELSSGRTARYFPPARVSRDGLRTIMTTRTANGQPVVLTIEPGQCRASDDNQTALRAQLDIEGRRFSGCAEDGGEDNVPARPTLLGDHFLEDGVRATGRNGEWTLGVGGIGATYLMHDDDYLRDDSNTLRSRVDRRAATYTFTTDDRRSVTATVRVAPCSMSHGTTHSLTVDVSIDRTRLSGCGWLGNLPPPLVMMSDGGTGPELRSGTISNDDDYPVSALRSGASGAVTVRYVVGADGRVTSCDVQESSGNPSLDSTTCAVIQRRFRFQPARDSYGQQREAARSFRMVWRLPLR